MKKYKKVHLLPIAEAAYLAGIIDGEGTITLTRKEAKGPRQLAVTISSCEQVLLKYALKTTGAGVVSTKRIYGPNHSPAFSYRILNRQALSLLEQIAPYLRTYKAKRSKLILEKYLDVTPRNGKYNPVLLRQKEKFEKNFFAIVPQNTKDRQGGLRVN